MKLSEQPRIEPEGIVGKENVSDDFHDSPRIHLVTMADIVSNRELLENSKWSCKFLTSNSVYRGDDPVSLDDQNRLAQHFHLRRDAKARSCAGCHAATEFADFDVHHIHREVGLAPH